MPSFGQPSRQARSGIGELLNRRKDGTTYAEEMTITPIAQNVGQANCTHFIAIKQDITERKRAEEELYRAHQMLQTILNTIPQRVFWKDRNCTYVGCNRAFATDAGLNNPAEIIGKSDFDLAWSETAEVYRADDKLVMEQGSAKLGYEEVQDRPDGGQMWLRTSKLPLWDREGKVIGVIGTYEDITERKVAEERVQFLAYYDALTGLPNRTLLQDRLSQGTRQLLAGERTKLRFCSSISTGSKTSTTRWGTRSATSFCRRLQNGLRDGRVNRTPWPGWAETNSSSC